MTSAQFHRLESLLDDIRSLVSDIEEDARDRGVMEGEEMARAAYEALEGSE